MVSAGAERSSADYETLIAHYNIDLGVVDPPAVLNEVAKDLVCRLLVYASFGFAAILDLAISEKLMWHHQKWHSLLKLLLLVSRSQCNGSRERWPMQETRAQCNACTLNFNNRYCR